MHVVVDGDLGAVAAAIDDDGQIVATASSHIEHGVYVAVDEATVSEATGGLLPAELWERAQCPCEDEQ
jgi:hypothetical protein